MWECVPRCVPRVLVAVLLTAAVVCLLGSATWAAAPTCSISGPSSGNRGDLLCFTATATDPDGGAIVSYDWDFDGGLTPGAWWDVYNGDVLPAAAGWTLYDSNGTVFEEIVDIGDGNYAWHVVDTVADKGKHAKYPDLSLGATVVGRYRYVSNTGLIDDLVADIETATHRVRASWDSDQIYMDNVATGGGYCGSVPADTWHVVRVTVDPAGNWNTYLDESPTPIASGTGGAISVGTRITIGANSKNNNGEFYCDWFCIANSGVWAPGQAGGPLIPGSGVPEGDQCAAWTALGSKTISLTVTDDQAETGTCTYAVEIENLPPTCSIDYGPLPVEVGTEVTFTATASDPDGSIASYAWDFGDGGTDVANPAAHTYTDYGTGSYAVTCTVTDNDGGTATCSATVTISLLPICSFTGPTGGNVGDELCWDGSASSDPDGGSIVSYEWSFGDPPPDPSSFQNGGF
jgi:hypothetical protein